MPLNPTSPFCPVTQYTGSLAGASLARSVCSRVDTGSWRHPPPPQAAPFLSCARRGVPCVADGWVRGWVDGGLPGGVTARSYLQQARPRPPPLPPPPGSRKFVQPWARSWGTQDGEAPCPKRAGLGSVQERFPNNSGSYNNDGFCSWGGFYVASTSSFKHMYVSTCFVPYAIPHPDS